MSGIKKRAKARDDRAENIAKENMSRKLGSGLVLRDSAFQNPFSKDFGDDLRMSRVRVVRLKLGTRAVFGATITHVGWQKR